MSIRPVNPSVTNPDGSWTFIHDDWPGGAHTSTILPTAITFGQRPDGTTDHRVLIVTCPVDGAVSYHPIAGGADADMIQRLFVYRLMTTLTIPQAVATALGLPAGYPLAPPRTWAQAKALVKAAVTLMDGADRWRLETVNQGG